MSNIYRRIVFFILSGVVVNYIFSENSVKSQLTGTIYNADSSKIVQAAVIWVDNIPWGEVNNWGKYSIMLLPNREYKITVSRIGYKTVNDMVFISTKFIKKNYYLTADVIQFPEILVEKNNATIFNNLGHTQYSIIDIKRSRTPILLDPIRALEGDPSITVESDMNSRISVRGGTSDQVKYIIDYLPLFEVYHIGGILSAINPDPLYSIDLTHSGFQGDMTEGLSGLIKINTLSESEDSFTGKISLGLLSQSYFVQSQPFAGQYLHLAYRRTHYNTAGRIIKNTFPYGFSDFTGKWNWRITENFKLSLLGFKSTDFVTYSGSDSLGNNHQIKWGNNALGIEMKIFPNTNIVITSNIYFSSFWNSANAPYKLKYANNEVGEIGSKNMIAFAGEKSIVRLGFQIRRFKYDYNWLFYRNEENKGYLDFGSYMYYDWAFPREYHNDHFTLYAYWLDYEKQLWADGYLLSTIRLMSTGKDDNAFLPTIRYTQNISGNLQFMIYYDRLGQILEKYQTRSVLDIMSIWFNNKKISKMDQIGAECKYTFKSKYSVGLATYLRDYTDLGKSINTGPTLIYGGGQSGGLEITMSKIAGIFQWKANYAWGYSLVKFADILNYNRNDKRHRFHFEATSIINKKMSVTISHNYNSGSPYYPWDSKYIDNSTFNLFNPSIIRLDPDLVQSNYNTGRLPSYNRVDISVSYNTTFKGNNLIFNVSIFNLFDNENIYFLSTPNSDDAPKGIIGIPILPSIEIQYEFK